MPVGPYETFKECVTAQMKKGRDKKSAQKICGAMEKRSKGSELDASELKLLMEYWTSDGK